MPVFLLDSNAHPLVLVVEVLLALVVPNPALLLDVTMNGGDLAGLSSKVTAHGQRRCLQETPRKHEVGRDIDVAEEV